MTAKYSNRGSEGCSVLDLLRHVQGIWQSQALAQCVLGMPLQLLPVGMLHSVLLILAAWPGRDQLNTSITKGVFYPIGKSI